MHVCLRHTGWETFSTWKLGWKTNGIANIFVIPYLKKLGYHITYDIDDGIYILTNKTTGVSVKFQEWDDRLPYIQATEENKSFVKYVGINFVQTVHKNYERFT